MLPYDFYLENRFYYKRLNRHEKSLYAFWVEMLLLGHRSLIYLPSAEYAPNPEEVGYAPCFFYGRYGDKINYYKVWCAIIYDCPELYFIYHNNLEIDRERCILYFGGDGSDYTDCEIEEINARLEEILREFDGVTDPFELELAVHDYITEHYGFDFDGKAEIDDESVVHDRRFYEKFTVVGLIKNGVGVCGGFIKLLQFVLQRRGLEVANILANAGERSRLHSWLAVKLGGKYYHLDVTFDEGDTLNLDYPQYRYFNVTDREIRLDHEFSHKEYPELVCNSTKYNYYRKMGLYFNSYDKITEAFSSHLDAQASKDDHSRFYFRTPKRLKMQKVSYALGAALKRHGMPMTSTAFAELNGYYAVEINGS